MTTTLVAPMHPASGLPTPATGSWHGFRPGRRLRATLAALLLGVTVVGTAQAYTTTARTGVPVTPTIYKVQGAHYDIGSAVTGPMLKPWVFQSGPVVSRVSPTGAQTVQVAYRVERWTGTAWALAATQNSSVTIASTLTSAKAPNLSVLPTQGSGYYRVFLTMTWTSPIGAVLGSMSVAMSTSSDYVCSTTRTCSVGAGWVFIGA